MDLGLFASLLWRHKETLETLAVGHAHTMNSDRGALFCLSGFASLVSHQLPRWQMDNTLETPEKDAELLLAPKLQRFMWDFGLEEGYSLDVSWTGFGDAEER